eukprot:UN20460
MHLNITEYSVNVKHHETFANATSVSVSYHPVETVRDRRNKYTGKQSII